MSIGPRPLRRDIRVFVSAVTRELGSIRKLVKKGLEDNDYHAVEQDNFALDYRDLTEKLRERIDSCDDVVHIAGHCYGAEPKKRPDDAPRRSYTQLEYDVAVELGKPVYVFLTGDKFPADPHEPEAAELRELQEAHRQRLTSTGRDYSRIGSAEQLDQKIRSLQLKVKRLAEELQQVDQQVAVTGGRLRRWLVAVAIVSMAALGTVGYVGWRQQVEQRAQQRERADQQRERDKQERERLAAEAARQEAQKIEQIEREIAERLLQELLDDKTIPEEEARRRALTRLSAVKLPLAEVQSLIDRKIAPRAIDASLSPVERARAALADGKYDDVFKAAEDQKHQGRELAMLEGTAALARFRQSPSPEWNARALAAFQRAMALADPNSPTEWQAWTESAVSAASVLHDLARYAEAEPLLRNSLRLREANNEPDSREVPAVLNNLGELLQDTNRLAEAEPLYRRALAIAERSYGSDHREVAIPLISLAVLLSATNRLSEAEALYRRALAILERSYSPDHAKAAADLNNLASLLQDTNRLVEAEPLYRRALAIDEKNYGPDHPNVATDLNNLAGLLKRTNRLAEAQSLYRRALAITEESYGPDHPKVATGLDNLAELLQATNRAAEAEPLHRRALAIFERRYGPNHPEVATALNNLALVFRVTNRLGEAEPLFRRALLIAERSYGPDHPDVAIDLDNLATLLQDTKRLSEAEPLYRRALAIFERSYGPDHPDVAIDLNNLAKFLQATKRLAEAEPLMRRQFRIFAQFQRSTGHEHPHFRTATENYRRLLALQKLAEPEITARIKAATEDKDKLSPIVPEVERLMGPAKPVAEVLASLDRQYREQGKPAVYFLKPHEPISPHLDELLRPNGDGLGAQGLAAFRRGAHSDAVVDYEAALKLMADQPAQLPAKLTTRMNRAAAMRELGLVAEACDELSKLLPVLERPPAADPLMKGRARYHLAICLWRLGERAAAERSAEESLTAYEGAPKTGSIYPGLRRQSEELLADVKSGKTPPPIDARDAPALLEAARARYRAREAFTKLALSEKAAPVLDQVLGPAKSTKEVFEALDRKYREQGKLPVWFLPLNEPIAPHLDQLLGPARTIKEVLDALDRQYRQQGKPAVWFLPLNEPMAPHLDELLGKPSKQ